MKKKIFTFAVLLLSVFLISTKSFSQPAPGDSGGGLPGGGTPDLIFNLGSTVIDIPATSPYYAVITSVLTSIKATIGADGVVTFPTTTCYYSSLLALFYTNCINYKTYQSCKTQPPPTCNPAPRSCGS